jgi:hypothetical protein
MRRILIVLFVSLGLLGLMAGPAAADHVGPHNHFLTVPGTGAVVQVAPDRCQLGAMLQTAFHQFHNHVHTGAPAGTGGLVITVVFCQ